ncbi:hypothetical protein PY650_14725 [Rhizobium calliandrae]|uniref:Uncharacterized protein n=1 Tax=Rhizobium calliandrae TaxID=1312182 RepID=A0ABT7KFC2_9HYPH|nr:hypothetical protein [Rhizobium calliandrae]MDL2406892.1 hypothetical protein [Rhizobium calliandrae]
MRLVLTRTFLCVQLCTTPLFETAGASDLVIWSPVKLAPRTYQTTIGFRLPMAWEMSAGADLGLAGAAGGKILRGSELATLWGKAVDDRRSLAGQLRSEVALRMDTLKGDGTLYLGRSQSWIFSKDIDMQTLGSLNLNYVATRAEPASVTASQGVTMIFASTGTSISASGAVKDRDGAFSSTLGFNQPIAPNLNLSASFNDPLTLTPTGDVRVDYRIKW